MRQNNHPIHSPRAAALGAREKLLLLFFCLFSLSCAAYFLATLRPVQASSNKRAAPLSAAAIKNVSAKSSLAPVNVSEVVAKALAFKALLSSTQQATLEQTYTTTLARRWSNLPCGSTCRNGIQLGSLTETQLAAALEVIKAAAGTVANEGSDEFNQIRLADTYLSSNGGGSSYGEGIYFLSFLNTPSATGAWMLQYGGHHYGANIAFNQGHVVGTTPLFEGVEPISFTANGVTYAPITQERDALATMLASLNSTQLASAKLSTTFSDVTLSPGESNGGNGTFPTTKVGLAVSTLSDAQKLLVLEAMKPWVQDADDLVARNLLAIYQSELNGTFIAYTGDGTSGDASSFLNANTNYARIDGPSVWIEFACQNGVVFPSQIHYHSVWRDHSRDYGADLSLTTPLDTVTVTAVAGASAASFAAGSLAPNSIASLFGAGLASSAVSATTMPLPTTLAGAQAQVVDSAATTLLASLFYASPTQINFLMPAGAASGSATINVLLSNTIIATGSVTVVSVAPGLFTANLTGSGVPAALILRVKADGTQVYETLSQFDSTQNTFVATAIALGDATEQVYLVAFGTGVRNRSSLSAVVATIGGVNADVLYAGPQGQLEGLDQLNILIPRSLAGRGDVNVVLSADGVAANTVTIKIK